jgi:hypothetical protein
MLVMLHLTTNKQMISYTSTLHTLKIGHVSPDIRVQGINNHLSVDWTCDLDTSVLQTWPWSSSLPCITLPNVCGFREKVWKNTPIEFCLTSYTFLQ